MLLLLLAAATAPSADAAVSRSDAAKKALAALGTGKTDAPAIVFGLRKPLRSGSVVGQAGPAGGSGRVKARTRFAQRRQHRIRRAGVQFRRPDVVMRAGSEPAWFFYEDRGPHQNYEHPGRVVLVGARTGRVRTSSQLRWVPLVNGRQPAFFRSAEKYESKRFRVFSRPWTTQPPASRARTRQAPAGGAAQKVADALAAEKSCAYRISDTLGDFFDFGRVDKTRARLGEFFEGLEALNAGFVSRRYTTKEGQTPIQVAQAMIDEAGCRDLLIYTAGAAARTGEAGIVIGMRNAPGGAMEWHVLSADELDALVDANPNVTFKFLFDFPYSGRVTQQLNANPNVLITLASSGPDETSFLFVPEVVGPDGLVGNPDNPNRFLEFTNAIINGITAFAASDDEVEHGLANGGISSMMVWMLARGMGMSNAWMFSAPSQNLKLPAGVTPPGPPQPPPVLGGPPNHSPLPTTPAQTTREDTATSFELTANDPDGDALTFSIVDGPDHGDLAGTAPNLTYTPDRDYTGSDSIEYLVEDGRGGSANGTVNIVVTPVNDPAAVVTTSAGVANYLENDPPGAIDAALSVDDVDSSTLEGATVTIAEGRRDGDTLEFTDTSEIVGTFDPATGVLALTGDASVADYEAALQSVEYWHDGDDPLEHDRVIEFLAEDGDSAGVPGDRTVEVEAVNDAPVLTVPGPQTTDEDAEATIPAITVADPDLGAGDLAVSLGVDDGTLDLATTSGLAGVTGDGTDAVTFEGTIAEVEAALAAVDYTPDTNFNGSDTLTVGVDDQGATGTGGAKSDSDTVAITVDAVNDAPANTVPGAQSLDEDATKAVNLSVADVDLGSGDLAIDLTVDHGTLTLGSTTGLANLSGDGTDTVAFEGTAAEVTDAMTGLTYAPDADYNGSDTLELVASDQGSTGSGGTQTDTDTVAFTVAAVNDAPVVSVPATLTTDEDTSDTLSPSVADVDADGDDVQVDLAAAHGTLTLATTSGLTSSSGDGTGAVQLVGSIAEVNAALTDLDYDPAANYNGSDSIEVDVDDLGNNGSGGALTDSGSVAVTVSAVNDGPVNTVPGAQTTDEDTPKALTLSAADVDAAGDDVQVTLSTLHGVVTLATTSGLTSVTGDGTSSVEAVGSLSEVNAAMTSLSYAPDANYNGSDTLTLVTDDLGNNGSGGALSDSDDVALTVSAVNDAPVNTVPGAQTLDEDTTETLSGVSAISVADVDAGGDDLAVSLSVANGVLTLADTSGLAFTTGDGTADGSMVFTGAASDVNTALDGLDYAPDPNFNGSDTLQIVTSDQGSTGSGGAKSDTDTVGFTVSAVNDAPVSNVPATQNVVENATLTLSGATAPSISDIDAGSTPVEVTFSVTPHGTLTLDGLTGLTFTTGDGTDDATMTLTGTVSDINAALDGATYEPGANETGDATVTLAVDDQGATGSGGALTDSESFTVDVEPLNIAPVNSVPGAQAVDEDTNLTFSSGNSNLISISDADAGSDPVQVTLGVADGVLTLGGTSGLTFSDGANASGAMTFQGTITDINAALSGLVYRGDSNFNGSDTLTITTDDLGNNGAGGAQSDTDNVALTVNAVNDGPQNSLPAAQSVAEGGTLTLSSTGLNGISISDVDSGSGAIAVELDVTNGTLTLPTLTGLTFSSGDGTGDASMDFTGTLAAVNTALDGMTFTPAADYYGAAQLDILTSDQGNTGSGGALTDSDALAITVTGVNDAPTINGPSSFSLDENSSSLVTLSAGDIDADSNDVEITLGVDHGTLTLATTSGLTVTDGANGSGAMTFEGTIAEVNAAMTDLTYEPTANYFGADTLAAGIDDKGHTGSGGALTASKSIPITINEANSPPVNSVPGTQTFDEDTTRTFSSGNSNAISVSDPDAAGDDVETTLTATNGILDVTASTGDLTSATGDGTGTVVLTGSTSEVTAALAGLVYDPDADYNGSATITVATDDLGHNGAGGAETDSDVVNLTISAVNDAPTLNAPADFDVDEGATKTLTGAAAHQVTDVDAGVGGVEVTMSVAHGTLTTDGTTGLTFTTGDGTADPTVTFTGTVANVNAALDGLQYNANNNDGTSDTLQIGVDDQGNTGSGGALTDSDSIAITINALNEAPVHTVPGTQTFDEDTTRAFSTGNGNAISVADGDAGSADVRTTLTATQGLMSIDTTGLDFSCGSCAGDGTNDATMTFEGTISEINAALQTLTYAPNANYNGAATITIETDDLGNTGGGGAQSDSDVVNLSITAVNDGPQNTVPGAQSVDEDTNLVFSGGNGNRLSIADVDAGASDVRVTLAATNGVLTLGGSTAPLTFGTGDGTSDATMTFDGTVAEVNTAMSSVTFRGTLNFNGSAQLSLTTNDLGNTGSGGSLSDTDTVAITVNPINDAPVATDETFNGNDSAHGNTAMVVNDSDDAAPVPTYSDSSTGSSVPMPQPRTTVSGDILANDTDVDDPGSSLTVTPGTFPTVDPTTGTMDGGQVTIEADGDFTVQPPAGCTDSDTAFDYTLEDNSSTPPGELTDTGRVTIAIAGCVWYVHNIASGNHGTSAQPYDTLAQAEAASAANHTVFVYDGDNATTGYNDSTGYAMNAGERLIGEHEGLTVDQDHGTANNNFTADALHPANADKHPTFTANGADVVDLDDGNELRGFNVDPSGNGGGIFGGSGDTGGATIDDVNIIDNGAKGTQPGLELDGTTGTFNVSNLVVNNGDGSAATTTDRGVRLANAGTVNFAAASQISITTNGAAGLNASSTSLGTNSTFDAITVTNSGNGGVDVALLTGSGTQFGDGTGTDLSLTTTQGSFAAFAVHNSTAFTVPAGGQSDVNSNGGPAVAVSGTPNPSMAFDGVSSTNSANDGVDLDGLGTGTFSAAAGDIGGYAGIGLDVNGGSGNITNGGSLNDGGGVTAVEVTGRTGGTVAQGGPINDDDDNGGGIVVNANSGGSTNITNATKVLNTGASDAVTFTSSNGHVLNLAGGGLDIDTTTGNGLNASSGTLQVWGSGNTINSTGLGASNRALSISGTTIGSDDVIFQSISSVGGVNGIRLANTGTTGNLSITGTGADDSGGTISNTSADAVSLTNTDNFTADEMNIQNPARDGFSGTGVTNFTVTDSYVNNAGQSDTDITDSAFAFNTTSAANENNIDGNVTITGNSITNPYGGGVDIFNHSGTISSLNVSNNTLTSGTGVGAVPGTGDNDSVEDGIQVVTFGGTGFAANLTAATVNGNTIVGFPDGTGIEFLGGSQGTTQGFMGTRGTANKVVISNNLIRGHSSALPMGQNGIVADVEGRGGGHFEITNNGTSVSPIRDVLGSAILAGNAGDADAEFEITGNFADLDTSIAGSSGIGIGTDKDIIADASTLSDPDIDVNVANNFVTDSAGSAIRVLHRDSNGTINLKMQNNEARSRANNGTPGISINNGSSGDDAFDPTMCAIIANNTAEGAVDGFGDKRPGIELFKRIGASDSNGTYTFGIQGLSPSPATGAQAEDYVATQNPASVIGNSSDGSGFFNKKVKVRSGNHFESCTVPAF